MRKNARSVALLILVSNVLLSSADEITRAFVLNPKTLGIGAEGSETAQDSLRNFLKQAGVDVDAAPRPKFFYNGRTGILHVTAEEEVLANVGREIRAATPRNVLIRVVLVEADQPIVDTVLGPWTPDQLTWPEKLDDFLRSRPRDLYSRVITEDEAKVVIRSLEQREGADMATPPPQMVLSGRQARLQVENHEPVTIPPFYAPGERAKRIIDSFAQ